MGHPIYLLTTTFEAFKDILIALYNTLPRTIFINTVGNAITVTKVIKLPGRPTNILADPKKDNPLTIVPKLNPIKIFILSLTLLPIVLNIKYITCPVINLSIILGNCPPGNLVVKAVIIPIIMLDINVVL